MRESAVDERTELKQLEADMAAIRVEVALLRLQLAWKRYNPDQPRVPAGNPDGGQWTDGGGDEGLGDDPWGARWLDREPELRPTPTTLDGRPNRYKIDMDAEEARSGHTVRDHVGKTDRQLVERIEREKYKHKRMVAFRFRNGTFVNKEEAREYIEKTLSDNQVIVSEVGLGLRPDAFIVRRFGYPTGREAYIRDMNDIPMFRPTYAVGVYIFHDPRSPNGFTVRTAYPINQDLFKEQAQ